jgi:tRNA/rRNA methyltransferase
MHIAIVLVEPARPGNVGAAARAMKTMGFSDLRIVGSEGIHRDATARAFAHASTEILDAARTYGTLPEAIADVDIAVATTGRRRGKRRDYSTPEELRERFSAGAHGESAALVFGREESGLSNEELALCQLVSLVPMRVTYPSLNLGQAVMVYTYALSPLFVPTAPVQYHPAREASVQALARKAETLLPALGFDPGRAVYRRMMERLGAANQTDVNLLHSLLKAIELHLPPSRE